MKTINKLALIQIVNRKVRFVKKAGLTPLILPGGKPEPGEDDLQALSRELREEMNVELLLPSVSYLTTVSGQTPEDPETVVSIRCYWGKWFGEPTPGQEIEEIEHWLTSMDGGKTTASGNALLEHLKKHDLID